MVNIEVWIPGIQTLSGDVTYYCEYGSCFLISYFVFKLENVLLLPQRAKENIWSLKYCWQTKQDSILLVIVWNVTLQLASFQ